MGYYQTSRRRAHSLSDWPTMFFTFIFSMLCWGIGYHFSIGFPLTEESIASPTWTHASQIFTNKIAAYVTGLFLIIIVSFIMQRISDVEMLISERTRLPFMIFIILISTNADLLPISNTTIVLMCLVYIIYELYGTYQMPEATGKIYNAAFFVGIASLFMPQMIWFMPLMWIGMYQFRSICFKSFTASVTGLLMVYWFVLGWCVWKHDFLMFKSFFLELLDFKFFSIEKLWQYYRIGTVGVLLSLLAAFFNIKIEAYSNSVKVRLMLSFLLNIAIWALILLFIYGKDIDSFLAILYLPSSVLIAYFLENKHRRHRFILYYLLLLIWIVSFAIRVWSFL